MLYRATEPLYTKLADAVAAWQKSGYACPDYPLIGEILAYQREEQANDSGLKFLREPQFLALQVYWYVRLVLKTPHIIELYKRYYNEKETLFKALGVSMSSDAMEFASTEAILEKIKKDKDFVKEKRIDALHEAAVLDYPSYILALAMGAGKTALIGTIIATEFAMSLRYRDDQFMKNALVFAPGTTIIDSLRELSNLPYEKILPPDVSRDFLTNLKIEYPNKGKEIQAQAKSGYNLIVTNTEKISLRANRKRNQDQLQIERAELQANLRLAKIVSLPGLGIFSDEAHHTYGNTFKQLKRVRQTINYIHQKRPVVAVINTTGTPYYKKKHLTEVIVWYGLGEGIRDNILKDLNDGIQAYDIRKQEGAEVFADIIQKFFKTYGQVSLADGAKAKIAFYFKTQQHLDDSRQLIEQAMTKIGENVTQVLVNTQASKGTEIDQFKRLNSPSNQKRVILLIGKGVEGWNCPSLFACALIKEQTSSNYVLQAATRCLRQTVGNQHSAKLFLDYSNIVILDKELQSNFRTDLDRLSYKKRDKKDVTLRILKTELPKLEITRTVARVVRTGNSKQKITLKKPEPQTIPKILLSILTPDFSGPRDILTPTGDTEELPVKEHTLDCYSAAWKIASRYHVPMLLVLNKIKKLYSQKEIPHDHLYGLSQQLEQQQVKYEKVEQTVKEVMALIHTKDENEEDLFEQENDVYVHRLRLLESTVERMKADDLLVESSRREDRHDLSFHYTPYNFDSKPERSFFQKILEALNLKRNEIEAFLFTGGLTDANKTDFHFEYKGTDNRYHRYFPDFVIIKKTGEFYIVEVKADDRRDDPNVQAKAKAVERLQEMQPDKFKYRVVYVTGDNILPANEVQSIINWMRNHT